MTTGKTIALSIWNLVGGVISLLFNMLSGLVIGEGSGTRLQYSCLEEDPGRLQSLGSLSRTQLSNFTFTFYFHALEKEMATHSSVLAWRIPGTEGPGGLPSMGLHRVGHDWRDLAAAAGLVIAFLPGNKRLLISWLQSPSAVILEPKKIKSVTVSTVSPSIYHDVMGPEAMILVFWMLHFKPAFYSPLSPSSRGSL